MQKFLIALGFLLVTGLIKAAVTLPTIPATPFLITDYGASTTSSNNAAAINAAITAASKNTNGGTGGTVIVPAGTFLSGPITMLSNVNLHLSEGAVLQMMPYGSYPGSTNFISIVKQTNVAITGKGTIEGDGLAWWMAYKASSIARPCMVRFEGCHTILVDSITLHNAPNVHLTVGRSSTMGSDATVSNITVYADVPSPNTDCIDTWYWNGINIVNCNLSGGDDNIAMDSYTQNITVKHCTFGRGIVPNVTNYNTNSTASTGHGCSIGSYTIAVQNVLVDSCTFNGTDYGIRLKSDRDRSGNGANAVQNITYSNIAMTNVAKNPIYMTCYYNVKDPVNRPDTVKPLTVTTTTPQFRDITIRNVTSTNSSAPVMALYGLPEMPISNVVFDNVHLTSSSATGVYVAYVNGLAFNCSSITKSGTNAIVQNSYYPCQSTITGIDLTTGAATNCVTGLVLPAVSHSVSCYPNPVSDKVYISAEYPINTGTLFSVDGIYVKTVSGNGSTQLPVDMSYVPKGYYFARIVEANNRVSTLKVIKN